MLSNPYLVFQWMCAVALAYWSDAWNSGAVTACDDLQSILLDGRFSLALTTPTEPYSRKRGRG